MMWPAWCQLFIYFLNAVSFNPCSHPCKVVILFYWRGECGSEKLFVDHHRANQWWSWGPKTEHWKLILKDMQAYIEVERREQLTPCTYSTSRSQISLHLVYLHLFSFSLLKYFKADSRYHVINRANFNSRANVLSLYQMF